MSLGAGQNSSNYVVRAGDTFAGIAKTVWGDSSLWFLIADANGLSGDTV
jgi:nucleoid-associated protein YgaU